MFVPVDVIFQEIHVDNSRGGNSASKYGPHVPAPITVLAGRESFCAVGWECRSLLILAWSHETCGPTLKDMPSDRCVGRQSLGFLSRQGVQAPYGTYGLVPKGV